MAQVQIQTLSHRHQEMADWLISHPEVKNLQELANYMNVSRSWLSIVMNSDVFKEYWQVRRAAKEKDLREQLVMKQLDITLKALTKLDDIIASDEVDDRLILDIATKTAQNCGFGTTPRKTVTEEHTQELTRAVDAGTLATARETFRRITRVTHVPSPESE